MQPFVNLCGFPASVYVVLDLCWYLQYLCRVLRVWPNARPRSRFFYIFTNSLIFFSVLSELQVQWIKETRLGDFSRYYILLFLHRTFEKWKVGIDNCLKKFISRYKKFMYKKYSIFHFQFPISISHSPFPIPRFSNIRNFTPDKQFWRIYLVK